MIAAEDTIVFVHPYITALPDAVTHTMTQLGGRLRTDGRSIAAIGFGGQQPNPAAMPVWEVSTLGLRVQARWTRPILQVWFLLAAVVLAMRRRSEISWVVTVDTPSGIGLVGVLVKACTRGRVRHACWVLDLVADQVKELNYHGPYRWLDGFRRFLTEYPYRLCDVVVTIGQCMQERLLAKGVDEVVVIPQWQDAGEVFPERAEIAKAHFRLSSPLIALYSGNADVRHPLGGALEAAELLRQVDDVLFLFVGSSHALLELEALAAERGLDNMVRWDPVPWSDLGLLLSAGDVHLVSLASRATGTCVPSKAYSAMAVARPVIFLGDVRSQVGRDLRAARAGVVLDPDDAEGLARALLCYRDDPARRAQAGEGGYDFFLKHRELKSVAAAWSELLNRERSAA